MDTFTIITGIATLLFVVASGFCWKKAKWFFISEEGKVNPEPELTPSEESIVLDWFNLHLFFLAAAVVCILLLLIF